MKKVYNLEASSLSSPARWLQNQKEHQTLHNTTTHKHLEQQWTMNYNNRTTALEYQTVILLERIMSLQGLPAVQQISFSHDKFNITWYLKAVLICIAM